MKRVPYDKKVKATILSEVTEARKSGKSWPELLQIAVQAGYKGNVESLTQFLRSNTVPKQGSTKAKPKSNSTAKAKTRSTASSATERQSAAPVSKPASSLDITALVHKTVTDAVANALELLAAEIKRGL